MQTLPTRGERLIIFIWHVINKPYDFKKPMTIDSKQHNWFYFHCFYTWPLLLTYILAWISNYIVYKVWDENWKVISPHSLLGMQLLIHAGIKLNHANARGRSQAVKLQYTINIDIAHVRFKMQWRNSTSNSSRSKIWMTEWLGFVQMNDNELFRVCLLKPSTHWDRDKMAAISQTTFSNSFSCVKSFEFQTKFLWRLFLKYS